MPLVFEDVHKSFAGHAVLCGVSFDVAAGECVALIGPSGAGKSTLLRCVNGLTCFDAGRVRVGPHELVASRAGRENAATSRLVRRVFGMVFQDFQLFPHLRAVDNIALAPERVLGLPRGDARALAMQLLERVGLGARALAYPRELSGGQKQRVAIARALAVAPRGLLCDEITSALDPELRKEVVDVLEDLRKDGLTLLLATHDLALARHAADRVLLVADGTVVESGPTEQMLSSPASDRMRRFLGLTT
jgi:ABC-type polar amino acid transport system ATPase subunit